MRICKNCETSNDDMCIYCSNCGSILDSSSSVISDENAAISSAPQKVRENPLPHRTQTGKADTDTPAQKYYQTPSGDTYRESTGRGNTQENTRYANTQESFFQQPQPPFYNPNQAPVPQEDVKKGSIIAALILACLFGGIIGIVLAVLALTNANAYENAKFREDATEAGIRLGKAKTYRRASWIFNIISIAFVIIASMMFILIASFDDFEDDFGDYEYYEQFTDEDDFELPFDQDDFDAWIENGGEIQVNDSDSGNGDDNFATETINNDDIFEDDDSVIIWGEDADSDW